MFGILKILSMLKDIFSLKDKLLQGRKLGRSTYNEEKIDTADINDNIKRMRKRKL